MLIAEAKGVAFLLVEFSAEFLSERAIFLGSLQVKTPASKSRAIEVLVTLPDQFLVLTVIEN